MKTLIVKYLPRAERSHTAKLLEAFVQHACIEDTVQVDLCEEVPEMFIKNNLLAYVHRNYLDEEISLSQEALLRKNDMFCTQLMEAQKVVLAFPMHNFSLPAIFKAWFDSVMQKGKTFSVDEDGYHGLLQARKAVIFMASGGMYEGDMAAINHASTLAKFNLQFMGIDAVEVISVGGMNLPDGKADERLEQAICKARSFAGEW